MSTDAAKPATRNGDEISVGGVKVRPYVTLVLYGLLVAAGGAALWALRNPTEVPAFVARGAPWVFLVFAVGFAAYRFALVVAHRYGAFKAFFQVAVSVAVFFLLLQQAGAPVEPRAAVSSTDLAVLFKDPDPQVRALAAEVARYRAGGEQHAHALALLLGDGDETVRAVAHQTLVQFNSGTDLGVDPKPWLERFP
jgi:hypothetical protein